MKGSFSPSAASFYQDTGQKDNRLETSVDPTPLRKAAQRPGVHDDLLRWQSEELLGSSARPQGGSPGIGFSSTGRSCMWEGVCSNQHWGLPGRTPHLGSKFN